MPPRRQLITSSTTDFGPPTSPMRQSSPMIPFASSTPPSSPQIGIPSGSSTPPQDDSDPDETIQPRAEPEPEVSSFQARRRRAVLTFRFGRSRPAAPVATTEPAQAEPLIREDVTTAENTLTTILHPTPRRPSTSLGAPTASSTPPGSPEFTSAATISDPPTPYQPSFATPESHYTPETYYTPDPHYDPHYTPHYPTSDSFSSHSSAALSIAGSAPHRATSNPPPSTISTSLPDRRITATPPFHIYDDATPILSTHLLHHPTKTADPNTTRRASLFPTHARAKSHDAAHPHVAGEAHALLRRCEAVNSMRLMAGAVEYKRRYPGRWWEARDDEMFLEGREGEVRETRREREVREREEVEEKRERDRGVGALDSTMGRRQKGVREVEEWEKRRWENGREGERAVRGKVGSGVVGGGMLRDVR